MANRISQTLVHLFTNSYPFQDRIMRELGATSLSAFLRAFGLEDVLTDGQRERYLSPIRDMLEISERMEKMINKGCEVRLIGKDLHTLMDRIKHPETLARKWAAGPKLVIWVAIVSSEECRSVREVKFPWTLWTRRVGVTRFMRQGTMPRHVKEKSGSWGGDWWRCEALNENAIEILFVNRTERSAVEVGISIPNTWRHFENMFPSVRKIVQVSNEGSTEQAMIMPVMPVMLVNEKIAGGTIVDLQGKDENGVAAVRHIRRLQLSWHDNIFVRVQQPPADRPFDIPYAESRFELFAIPLKGWDKDLTAICNVESILPSLEELFRNVETADVKSEATLHCSD